MVNIAEKFLGSTRVTRRATCHFATLLLLFVGVGALGHTGNTIATHAPETKMVYATTPQSGGEIAASSDANSPCRKNAEHTDCNTCPSGHCHLQATSVSKKKILEFEPLPLVWIHAENYLIPATIAFEPALRPPIL